ncbi:MAG: hypothetical protein ACI9HK_004622, partial [Pirellulaceae bacterium]
MKCQPADEIENIALNGRVRFRRCLSATKKGAAFSFDNTTFRCIALLLGYNQRGCSDSHKTTMARQSEPLHWQPLKFAFHSRDNLRPLRP